MRLEDKIYGLFDITEPVLLELLALPAMTRLKEVSQYGVPDKYYYLKNFSRYEHCIGVMILLRKCNASVEEQIAGLLHDASHLAFSHVADWVFGEGRKGIEEFQNQLHQKFILDSNVPVILKKHDFSVERILDENNFSILENKIPDVCADRYDYAIREIKYYLNPKAVSSCLKGLKNYKNELVFDDKKSAFVFADNFLRLQLDHWGNARSIIRYYYFAKVLEIALEREIIEQSDFAGDEKAILHKVENCGVGEINEILSQMLNKEFTKKVPKRGEVIQKKFRYVDPKVLIDGKLKRVSELYPEFKKKIEQEKAENEKGILV